MKYMRLGNTGLTVSRIALGCMSYGSRDWRPWVLESDEAMPFFRRAIELGINFFDTADVYSLGVSEEVVGRALREFARLDEVVVATKVRLKMGDAPNRAGLPVMSDHTITVIAPDCAMADAMTKIAMADRALAEHMLAALGGRVITTVSTPARQAT